MTSISSADSIGEALKSMADDRPSDPLLDTHQAVEHEAAPPAPLAEPTVAGPVPATPVVRRRRPHRQQVDRGLRRLLILPLAVLGLLLTVPGAWALAVLVGIAVPMAERPDAANIATAMIVALPIAVSLFVAALFCAITGFRRGRTADARRR